MGIYEKLLKFQKETNAITKDSKNPFYNSKYFDINKILEVVKPSLSELGILLLQPLTNLGEQPAIQTKLIDTESGEELAEIFPFENLKDPQKIGSAITYYRRYSLQSMLGLEAVDDDGNHAAGKKDEKKMTYKKLCENAWHDPELKIFQKQLLDNFEIKKPSDLKTEENYKEFYEAIQRRLNGMIK
jgi:hypothetical protein